MIKGKLDNDTLGRLVFGRTGARRPEVIVGPGIGEDCAVLDFGECECVLSTDPITASASKVGFLAVHISCNDVASNGVEPIAIMLTILLPPDITEKEIGEIARQADEAAKDLGVQIIGGHTEVTDTVTQPLISATAIGRAPKGRSEGSRCAASDPSSGDLIVVTKKLALEGTAIAATQYEEKLRSSLTAKEIKHAKGMFDQISVVREGVIAGRIGTAAMHDVTEGGILGAVWEVCTGTNTGAEIDAAELPFDDITMAICILLDLDPMRLISSGSMLMFVKQEKWGPLSSALTEAGIEAYLIGSVQPPEHGIFLVMKNGEREPVGPPGPDEIYKIS
jgi:hydrogenase expression/formation protein HypE